VFHPDTNLQVNVNSDDKKAIKNYVFSSKTSKKRTKISVFYLFSGLKRAFFNQKSVQKRCKNRVFEVI